MFICICVMNNLFSCNLYVWKESKNDRFYKEIFVFLRCFEIMSVYVWVNFKIIIDNYYFKISKILYV